MRLLIDISTFAEAITMLINNFICQPRLWSWAYEARPYETDVINEQPITCLETVFHFSQDRKYNSLPKTGQIWRLIPIYTARWKELSIKEDILKKTSQCKWRLCEVSLYSWYHIVKRLVYVVVMFNALSIDSKAN